MKNDVTPLAKDYDVSIYVQDNQRQRPDHRGMPIQASSQSMIKSMANSLSVHKPDEIDADLSKNYRGDQGYLPGLYARKVRQCRAIATVNALVQCLRTPRQLYQNNCLRLSCQ